MSDTPDRESKTEQATEKRVSDAIEKGNVPVSKEVAVFTFMAGLLLILAFFLRDGAIKLTTALAGIIDQSNNVRIFNGADLILLSQTVLMAVLPLLLPIFIIIIAASLTASFVQNPPRLVFDRLKFDFSRVSPMEGWNRIFSMRGGVEFLKSLAKFIGIAVVITVLL